MNFKTMLAIAAAAFSSAALAQQTVGFATLQRLRATDGTRHLPVIILSSRAAQEMAGRGFKADVMDYVVRADPGPSGLTWNIDDIFMKQAHYYGTQMLAKKQIRQLPDYTTFIDASFVKAIAAS